MLKLFGAPGSVYVRKVRIALIEKSIPFESAPVSPMATLPDDYQSISPLKKIPALLDGDFSIADSSVICAYLEKKHPKPALYPEDSENYAQALWLEEFADTALFQAVAPCYYQTILLPLYRQQAPNQERIEDALTKKLPPVADYLSQLLAQRTHHTYIVGNHLSIADISIASVFFNMIQAGFIIDQQRWPLLSHYIQCLILRPSFQDCVADIAAEKAGIVALA